MSDALRWIAPLLVLISAPIVAQTQPNTVLTGVEGLPWGASRAQVEARLGAPDSVLTRGDSVNLIYLGRPVLGKAAKMMDVLIAPGAGLAAAAYLIQQTPGDCATTFKEVANGLPRSLPGLRLGALTALAGGSASADVARACRSFAENADFAVMLSQTLRDPTGPASVNLFGGGTRRRGTMVVVHFRAGERSSEH